jgi:hypothetical protein
MTDIPSPFDLATAELRALGIILARLPGEYRVNFRAGAESTARTLETLDHHQGMGERERYSDEGAIRVRRRRASREWRGGVSLSLTSE